MSADQDWLAQMDQMLSGVRDIARVTAAYYRELIAEGVPQDAATQIAGALSVALATGTGGDES